MKTDEMPAAASNVASAAETACLTSAATCPGQRSSGRWTPQRLGTVCAAMVAGLVMCALVGIGLRTSGPLPPTLGLSSTRLELSPGPKGGRVFGEFFLQNVGGQPLEYRITASCGCLGVEPASGIIAPGTRQVARASVLLDRLERAVRLQVHCNDPQNGLSELVIVARAVVPVVPSSNSLDFGTHLVGAQAASRETRLLQFDTGYGAPPLAEGSLTLDCTVPWVELCSAAGNPFTWQVRVHPETLPLGTHRGEIVINRAGFAEPTTVPVAIRIDRLIQLAPSTLFFRGTGREHSGTLIARRHDQAALPPLDRTRLPDFLEVAESSAASARPDLRVYTVWLTDFPPSTREQPVDLHFGDATSAVPLDVRLAVHQTRPILSPAQGAR